MLIRDQIPSFPDLIGPNSVLLSVAHGTTDHNKIRQKYYSQPEREHVEEISWDKIVGLLKLGKIRATGRRSDVAQSPTDRWQVQKYKQHSKIRSYVPTEY